MEKKSKVKQERLVSVKDSIKTKLITIMLIVVIVPMALATTVSYVTSTSKAKKDAQDSLEWQAWYIEDVFSKMIDKSVIAMQALAVSPSTIAYLQDPSGTTIPQEVMLNSMKSIDESLADDNGTAIENADGMQILKTKGDCVDVSEREYFQQVKNGTPIYVSDVIVSKATGKRQITIIIPVKDNETGEFIGAVQRNYDMNSIHEMLAAEAEDAFLLDRTGLVAAHSKYEIGEGAHEEEDRSQSKIMTEGKAEGFYINKNTGKGYAAYIAYVKEPNTNFSIAVAANEAVVLASVRRGALITIGIAILMIIIACVVAIMTANSINKPIQDITKSLGKLSEGEFNSIENGLKRKDEFGVMIRSTNSLIEKLTDIINNIKKYSSEVAISSNDLSEMTTQISQTTEDVSNAVQEIASGATQQADEIQTAVNATDTVSNSVTSIKDNSVTISVAAEEMESASKITSDSIDNLQKSSNETSVKIDDINDAINATKLAVETINEKVEGITSIATQTNLLSLNASIEAARAGEAGRGFAVVAGEIGKLAADSKQLADDIKIQMDELLNKSNVAVTAVGSVKESNQDTQLALGESLESINKMIEEIDKTVKGIEDISAGTDESINAKNSVVDVMSALSAISEENAASAEETGASMEELNATVATLNESADGLKNIANKLNEEMQFFKL